MKYSFKLLLMLSSSFVIDARLNEFEDIRSWTGANHPNVRYATECRQAIKDGSARPECEKAAQYFDICKENYTGLDNYFRAATFAEHALSFEDCHKVNELVLQANKVNKTVSCDNSYVDACIALVKAEKFMHIPVIVTLKDMLEHNAFAGREERSLERMHKRQELVKELEEAIEKIKTRNVTVLIIDSDVIDHEGRTEEVNLMIKIAMGKCHVNSVEEYMNLKKK